MTPAGPDDPGPDGPPPDGGDPTGRGPWDPGLQPERSSAAWSRTALAGTIVAALVARTASGTAGIVIGLVGLGAAGALSLLASRRIRRAVAHLHADRGIRPAVVEVAAMTLLAGTLPVLSLVLTVAGI